MEEIRFINKQFFCINCSSRFKKLVHAYDNNTSCPNCNSFDSYVVQEGEFNRENLDRTYRIQFQNGIDNQYHNITDIFDRNPNNIYGDPRARVRHIQNVNPNRETRRETMNARQNSEINNQRRQTTQSNPSQLNQQRRRQVIIENIVPNINPLVSYLFVSPFNGSVNRQPVNFLFADFFSPFFIIPNNEVFIDNFSSNFNSNFTDPLTRIIFIRSMNDNQPTGTPPTSKEALKRLKNFKMNEEYCKKEGDKLEYPTCSICLASIDKDQETILMPCGHLFHNSCIIKWLELHSNCPVCRYELPTDDLDYERNRNRNNSNLNFSNVRSS